MSRRELLDTHGEERGSAARLEPRGPNSSQAENAPASPGEVAELERLELVQSRPDSPAEVRYASH